MADDAENARPKGLLIPFDKLKLLNILDDKAFRKVFTAMAGYVQNGIEPDKLEPIEQIAFESMRLFLDENIKTYQRTVEANRENGRKGGRPRKATKTDGFSEKPKETHRFFEKPMETEENPQEPKETHENQSTKYKVQSTTDTKVSGIDTADAGHAPTKTTTSRFHPPDVEEVKDYFAGKGGTAGQAERFYAYYESNGWKVGRNPMKNWKAAASGWISRDKEQQRTQPKADTMRSAADVYADIFKGVI